MADIVNYGCNSEGTNDLCVRHSTAEVMRADAMPKPVAAVLDAKAGPSCDKLEQFHDSNLAGHIDAFTHGLYSGVGITQKDVGEMLRSKEFSVHEKAELRALDRFLPDAAELFKVESVSKAKVGAAIAWECKAKS